ncbi:MAG: ATP-dependent helicase [Bacilli bacterium]
MVELNKAQQEAFSITEGPLLILAGAGSGKTRVLTEKIGYLIHERNVSPYNILAITFTNKASKEMKERLSKKLGENIYLPFVSTFHSFGLYIIRHNYNELDFKSNITILDSSDSTSLIKRILKDFNIDPKRMSPTFFKNKISSLKNDLVSEVEFIKFSKSDTDKILLKIYIEYQKRLKSANSVDFDDLLILPIKLFKEHSDILEYYQERFKYIFIDEYQDTNEAQYILSKMLAHKYKNLCVVGDNDQSIYSWRGANYKNILNFEKDYKDANIVMLEENYRSKSNILNAANNVIKNNKARHDKNLWTKNEVGDKIRYIRAFDETNEAYLITAEIKDLVSKGTSLSNMAILYRTNAQSRKIEEEVRKEHINYKIVGNFYFYDRLEIKALISYLKLIYNALDNESLLKVVNYPKRGIGNKKQDRLISLAKENDSSIFDIIKEGKELKFKEDIIYLKEFSEKNTLTDLVDEILNISGIKESYQADDTIESNARLENLEEFKSITKTFEEKEGNINLSDFLDQISLVSDKTEYSDSDEKLTLMTIHAAKGLEFQVVFVIGFEEGIFPHFNSFDNPESLEEERRICYVALTRAKDKLYIFNARSRMLFGKITINPPSRFINEIGTNLIEGNIEKLPIFEKKDSFYEDDQEYIIGMKVEHEKYGIGIIVSVDNTIMSVAFSHEFGIKKFMKNHKCLRKVS